MAAITRSQIQRVYALGAGIGILESGNKEDDLHALVFKITGKKSVSELTSAEFSSVEQELFRLMRFENRTEPLKRKERPSGSSGDAAGASPRPTGQVKPKDEEVPGMMTGAQQGRAWKSIYRLIELDKGSKSTAGVRMIGAIKKILEIDAGLEAPFKWVNQEAGALLIEQLKRYVRSAERPAKKREAKASPSEEAM